MDVKDKILVPTNVPTNLQSLSVLPATAMFNSGLQTCGLNTGQQPALIPWSGAGAFSGLPMTVMPVLNQPMVTPVAPVSALSPPKDSLILVPLLPGSSHSQNFQNTSDLLSSAVSFPTLQPVSTQANSQTGFTNGCTVPLTVSSVTSLPILSQPSLHPHTQNVTSTHQSAVSGLPGVETEAKLLCRSAESYPQENATASLNTSYLELLNRRHYPGIKRQRTLSNSHTGARAVISPKSGNSSPASSVHAPENETEKDSLTEKHSLTTNELHNVHEQESERNSNSLQGPSQIGSDDISRIISSLPPGWKVVGLTSLSNTNPQLSDGSEKKNHTSPALSTLPITQKSSLQHQSSPPDVVSVDLNVSSALPSPLNTNSLNINVGNRSKCSVHLCDSLVEKSVSVKREIIETEGFGYGPDPPDTALNTDFRNSQVCLGNNELKMHVPTSPALITSIKTEPESWISSESDNSETRLEMTENQWTVVGVTSLPPTPVTPVNPVPQSVFPDLSPLISPQSPAKQFSLCQEGPPVKPVSPKATILNVPLPKISHSVKNIPTTLTPPSGLVFPKPVDPYSNALNSIVENSKQNNASNDNEWTVVGVTVCPSSVKTSSVYSHAENTKQLDNHQPSNLSAIPLETLKSHLLGNINGQRESTNFSEMIKTLSILISKDNKLPEVSAANTAPLSNEWKVVGITQLPGERSSVKLQENCHPLQPMHAAGFTSPVTIPTCTTTVSSSVISSATVTNSSLPCNTSSNVLEFLLKNNLLGKSSVLTTSESKPQQNQILQFLSGQLQLHQQQQQQPQLTQAQQEQQQEESRNLIPLLSTQTQSANALSAIKATMDLLNQYHELVGGLPLSTNQLNQNNTPNLTTTTSTTTTSKSPAPISSPNSSASGSEEQRSSEFDFNVSVRPTENPKSSTGSISKLENRWKNPKLLSGEKCFGKSDCVSRKAKDMCVRCMKKHTVSHLLQMKRTNDTDWSECHDSGDNFECVGQNFKIVKRLSDKILKRLTNSPRVERDGRSRPLHSYAGNRKMFSRPFAGSRSLSLERISLRSGTKVPVSQYESDCNESELQGDEVVESQQGGERKDFELEDNGVIVKDETKSNETRSAARKRKLKVPRKMVADLDYHPFDSSSDSN